MIGQVGNDSFGKEHLTSLNHVGVQTNAICVSSKYPTGTAAITVDQQGENRIVVVPGANDHIPKDHIRQQSTLLRSSKIVMFQLEISLDSLEEAFALLINSKPLIIMDPAPARAFPLDWYPRIDFLTPNLTELATLSGRPLGEKAFKADILEAASELIGRGAKNVIAKLGGEGALHVDRHLNTNVYPAPKIAVVDTTAAGDCFNGAFASRLGRDHDIEAAIQFAIKAASLSVRRSGAQPSIPTAEEVEKTTFG